MAAVLYDNFYGCSCLPPPRVNSCSCPLHAAADGQPLTSSISLSSGDKVQQVAAVPRQFHFHAHSEHLMAGRPHSRQAVPETRRLLHATFTLSLPDSFSSASLSVPCWILACMLSVLISWHTDPCCCKQGTAT